MTEQWSNQEECVDPRSLVLGGYTCPRTPSSSAGAHGSVHEVEADTQPNTPVLSSTYDPSGSLTDPSINSPSNGQSFVQTPSSATSISLEYTADRYDSTPYRHLGDNSNDDLLLPIPYNAEKLYGIVEEEETHPFDHDNGQTHPPDENPEQSLEFAAQRSVNCASRIERKNPRGAVDYFRAFLKNNGPDFPNEQELQCFNRLTGLSRDDILCWFDCYRNNPFKSGNLIQPGEDYRCLSRTCEPSLKPNPNKIFTCFDLSCYARFKKKDDLRKHMEIRNHTEDLFCSFSDPGCLEPFGRRDKFQLHMRKKHGRKISQAEMDKLSILNKSQKFPRKCPSCHVNGLESFKEWFTHWTDCHCPREATVAPQALSHRSEPARSVSRRSNRSEGRRATRISQGPRGPISDGAYYAPRRQRLLQTVTGPTPIHRYCSETDRLEQLFNDPKTGLGRINQRTTIGVRGDPIDEELEGMASSSSSSLEDAQWRSFLCANGCL
ncbi:hypothetical protein AJ79_08709 [Helicocarpus griseus UAMH5409]|uniref:C2H2-type domain-containing protein n=1 Tax=Helicocarpus griseus UAMH5409 TaxID=1447875 RepID=A0A2B7WR86_9EURO|nr:hypothetical protein AJ79_08709 [Helicocarpus griseus UAMH5409]